MGTVPGDSYVIKNITPRNVWMEDLFLFNSIKSLRPDKMFHHPSEYVLKYQPPASKYALIIPLDDPRMQESALIEIAKLDIISRNRLVFFFTTVNVTMPMYSEPKHPATLVEFKTKAQVMKKLTDFFLDGTLSIADIEQIFYNNYDTWRPALYNTLPADWQEHHAYLLVRQESLASDKALSKEYIDGHISIEAFKDLKFPERKKLKDIMSMEYPLPYEESACIIGLCNHGKGVIQCQNCDNMACCECVKQVGRR